MRKKDIEQIKEYACEIGLRVIDARYLRVSYSYEKMGGFSISHTKALRDVVPMLEPLFQKILKARGLLRISGKQGDLVTPMQGSPAGRRWLSLMPGNAPKYVRCWDNGGRSADRYTVCFTGRQAVEKRGRNWQYPYVAMSAKPYHPQGFGQHGWSEDHPCDTNDKGRASAIGRKGHLGARIAFTDLPDDCQRLVIDDYLAIWKL